MSDPIAIHGEVPKDVATICRTLTSHGHQAFVVGGAVRDLLLGKKVGDYDLATSATPQQVLGLFRRVVPTGIAHGTVTVLLGERGYEVTTFRGEGSYSDGRHPDEVHFHTDLAADLGRRDFTVNAMAYDPQNRVLTDPFGGQTDLAARLIRAVGEPAARFGEDGLRVLRAARFAASLEFGIEPATKAAMSGAAAMLAKVSVERKRDELIKLLAAARPTIGLSAIAESGLLPHLSTSLAALVGSRPDSAGIDAWGRTIARVDESGNEQRLRLAALLLDAANAPDAVPGQCARAWLTQMKLDRYTIDTVVALVQHFRDPLACAPLPVADIEVRRFLCRVGRDAARDWLSLHWADLSSRGLSCEQENERERLEQIATAINKAQRERVPTCIKELNIDGTALMRSFCLPPGPDIGRLLEQLLAHAIEQPDANTPLALLEHAARLTGRGDSGV